MLLLKYQPILFATVSIFNNLEDYGDYGKNLVDLNLVALQSIRNLLSLRTISFQKKANIESIVGRCCILLTCLTYCNGHYNQEEEVEE